MNRNSLIVIHFWAGLFTLLFLTGCSENPDTSQSAAKPKSSSSNTIPRFKELSPGYTGVRFSNKMIETNSFNYLFWTSIYNGAGVSVADFNGDGLQDFFVAGNIMPSKLYLNKGNMRFEDVTEKSGIKPDGKWTMGVTVGDVNGDGLPDIYLSKNSLKHNPEMRKNSLYVNLGNMKFRDATDEAGVGDKGFSTQAAFFDFDKDGDLDLFVGNQPPDKRLIVKAEFEDQKVPEYTSDHLYANDGKGHFTDITRKAGLQNWAYTLNVLTTDINEDGWTDLYITNDYAEPDFLYINNGDGSFTESLDQYIKHISNFAMGSDVGDINNDGFQDIGALDMSASDHYRSKTNMRAMNTKAFWQNVAKGNYYQYMTNTLQLNTGKGKYQEIAHYAHMAYTDWSWALLMADFDNDGWKDIFITNGVYRDVRNNDFDSFGKYLNSKGKHNFEPLKLIKQIPQTPLPNRFYHNQKNYEFEEIAGKSGLGQPGFSQGAAYADLDNDGDLDLIVNNLGDTLSIYRNISDNGNHYLDIKLKAKGKNTLAIGTLIKARYNGQEHVHEQILTRGYYSSSTPIVHFGLGDAQVVEKLEVIWPDGTVTVLNEVKGDQRLTIDQAKAQNSPYHKPVPSPGILTDVTDKAGLDFVHKENTFNDFSREVLLPHKESQNGPKMAQGDVNGDGLEDIFIGGALGQGGKLYIQSARGPFHTASSQPWEKDKDSEDMGALFFDADGDNDLDLYVVSGGSEYDPGDAHYQDRLYINDGKGSFVKAKSGTLPKIDQSGSVVLADDVDGDGDLDLFVGGRIIPGKYPYPPKSYYLQNEGGKFMDKTNVSSPDLLKLGLVTDALFVDVNGDKRKDIVAVGEWMPITVLINKDGKLVNRSSDYGWQNTRSWWWSVATNDINHDGRPDFVFGCMGKNHKFNKASPEKPFEVFGEDFDGDGVNDVVLAKHYKDKLVPTRGKDCSSEEMPFIKDKFPTYDAFARASIYNILPEDKLKKALHYKITDFRSKMAISKPDGSYEMVPLPPECQFSPIRSIRFANLDSDKDLEIIACGNLYPAEVETVRHDAGIGFVLDLKNGGKNIEYLSPRMTGFLADKDARSMQVLDNRWVIIANTNDRVQVYEINKKEL